MRGSITMTTCVATLVVGAGCGELLGVGDLHDRADATFDDVVVDAAAGDAEVEAAACAPTHGDCVTFPLCGCDAGMNCEVTNDLGTTTCTEAGTIPIWSHCTGNGMCSSGSTCIGYACKPYCDTAADCIGTNVTCEQVYDQITHVLIPGFKVCSAGCDLRNPSGVCGPGVNCFPYPWDGKGHDHGDCDGLTEAGMGPNTCLGTNTVIQPGCAPGWYCESDHSCEQWCRVGFNADCTDGGVCVGFAGNVVVIGNTTYGLCQ